jgi:hypothetical protein
VCLPATSERAPLPANWLVLKRYGLAPGQPHYVRQVIDLEFLEGRQTRRTLRPVVQRDGAVALHGGACWWVLFHDPISVVVGAWDVAAVE